MSTGKFHKVGFQNNQTDDLDYLYFLVPRYLRIDIKLSHMKNKTEQEVRNLIGRVKQNKQLQELERCSV